MADQTHTQVTLPALLKIGQTAERLQVSTKTIRRWIETGELIGHRIGKQWRISEADLLGQITQKLSRHSLSDMSHEIAKRAMQRVTRLSLLLLSRLGRLVAAQ